MAVIFVAIAPPLPEERSGKQKKNTLAVYWSTTRFGLYFYVKARKFGNLARIMFKPLVWRELMSPLQVLWMEKRGNYRSSHRAARLLLSHQLLGQGPAITTFLNLSKFIFLNK